MMALVEVGREECRLLVAACKRAAREAHENLTVCRRLRQSDVQAAQWLALAESYDALAERWLAKLQELVEAETR